MRTWRCILLLTASLIASRAEPQTSPQKLFKDVLQTQENIPGRIQSLQRFDCLDSSLEPISLECHVRAVWQLCAEGDRTRLIENPGPCRAYLAFLEDQGQTALFEKKDPRFPKA